MSKKRPVSMKYIYETKYGFQLNKQLNGKMITVGTDKDLNKIKKIRDYLVKNNWDLEVVKQMKDELNNSNYIYKINNGFTIIKYVNKERRYFGKYDTYEKALNQVEFLKNNDWNIEHAKDTGIKRDRCFETRYISKTDYGAYYIQKRINGKMSNFGVFDTLEEAIKERNLYEQCNWDWELICEHTSTEKFDRNKLIVKGASSSFYKPENNSHYDTIKMRC